MTDRILVTGGTGFIAGHTVLALLAGGYAVRATVRDSSRIPGLEALLADSGGRGDVDFAVADLMADDGWAEAMTGCAGLFHMASPFPLSVPDDPQEIIAPAVDGTMRALRAAAAAGVPKAVLTSSIAAVSYGRDGREAPFTEADWTDPEGDDATPYVQSKTLAERAAWDFVTGEAPNLKLASINPGLVLGPLLDRGQSTSVELVRRMMAGEMPGAPRIGFCVVDVRDVADLHVRAFEAEAAAGERYICSDKWMWLKEIGAVIRAAQPDRGRRAPTRELPSFMVRMAAGFDRSIHQILNELDQQRMADSTKAKSELGWSPRAAEEAVGATADSLVAMGMV